MMQSPWDRAQPDEWLPRNLRLCWGSSGGGYGGDSGGPGMGSGDTGSGWGGDSGFSGTTGGGDWGSAGSYDASGFNAASPDAYGAALGNSPGGYFDTGGAGIAPGALGAEFGGSFGTTGISGQPGAPSGAFGAEADAGGGGTTGVGKAIASWNESTVAGGPGAGTFADLSGIPGGAPGYGYGGDFGGWGGGGGGYTGGGGGAFSGGGKSGSGGGYTGAGGGGKSGGGSFSGGGGGKSGGGGYTGTGGGGKDVTGAAPAYGGGIGKGGASDETGADPDAGPAAAPDADPDAGGKDDAPLGTPPAADKGADVASKGIDVVHAAPSQDAPAAAAAAKGADVASKGIDTSAFGPQSLDPGSQQYGTHAPAWAPNDADVFAAPDQAPNYGEAFAVPGQETPGQWGDVPGRISGLITDLMSKGPEPQSLFPDGIPSWAFNPGISIPAPAWAQNPRSNFDPFSLPTWAQNSTRSFTDPWVSSKAADLAQSRIDAKSPWDISTFLSPINQTPFNTSVFNAITGALSGLRGSEFDQQAIGEQGRAGQQTDLANQLGFQDISPAYAGPFAGPDVAGDRGEQGLASQLGIESISPTQGIDPGGEQYGVQATDLPTQLGIDSIDTTPWGSVFEAPDQAPNYEALFEGAAPEVDPSAGGRIEGFIPGNVEVDPSGRVDAFIPGDRDATDFNYEPQAAPPAPGGQPSVDPTMESGPPGAPTTTDNAATPGSDPALSGYPAAPGAPGSPGVLGQPGTPGTPGAPPAGGTVDPGADPDAAVNAASNAALNAGADPTVGDAASQAAGAAQQSGANPGDIATAARDAALQAGATQEQATAIEAATLIAAVSQASNVVGTVPGAPPAPQTTSVIPGVPMPQARPAEAPAPPSLIEQAQQPSVPLPQARPADAPQPGLVDMQQPNVPTPQARPPEAPQPPQDDDDTPEPPDTPPEQDPNVPRPPGNVPGQLIGARDNYPNSHLDNPRNPFYQNSGRTNYPQGRPGVDYRTARQAGIEPHFRVGDYNVRDLDARLVERVNRAMEDMPAHLRDGLAVSSAYRPTTRAEAAERGMDERTSQESVYARGHAPGGRNFPAGRPGRSNHAPGRALDFRPGPALTWLRANAGRYGLETLGYRNGRIFDEPHIQLQGGGRGNAGQRPSAQEQAEQRAIDAQNRQAGRGQAPAQQARPAVPPGGWRGIGGDIGREARMPQAEVVQPPEVVQSPPAAPTALPPQPPAPAPVAPPDRPLANIPPPAPFMAPPRAGPVDPVMMARTIAAIQKEALRGINPNTTKEQAMAQGARGRAALIAAGVPPAMARAAMLDTGAKTAVLMGYGPGGKNATVMGFPIPQSMVQGKITEGVNEAMQGYNPAASGGVIGQTNAFGGPVQGPYGFQPDAPEAPGKRSDVPFGQQFARELTRPPPDPNAPPPDPNAPPPPIRGGGRTMIAEAPPFGGWPGVTLVAGGRDAGAPPAVEQEPGQQPGRAEWEAPLPGEWGSNLLGPMDYPVDPRSGALSGKIYNPDKSLPNRDINPDIFQGEQQQQQEYQQNLDPRGWQQASLLNLLQNLNPISTAEARGRGQGQSYPVPAGSTRSNPHFTFYGPGAAGKMEGGFETSRPNQAGTNVPITLDMVRSAREQGRDLDVTLASDPSRYGETINVGTITFVSPIDGKQYTLDNVRGFVHDTGSAFKGRPEKVDIAVSDYSGWSSRAAGDQTALAHVGAAPNAIVVAGPGETGGPAVGAMPAEPAAPMRGLAKGGHVARDEPVVVGEEGPEYFVPDQPGTVVPHMPQPASQPSRDIDRWPKLPAVNYPGQYGGVEREMMRQTRSAQDPMPSLMDMIDTGRLPLNEANWRRMISDPDLIALGRSRMEDRINGGPEPEPVAEQPPDPANPMAQALGYGSIARRPMRIGRQSYQDRR